METAYLTKMSVPNYKTTQCQNPEDNYLNSLYHESQRVCTEVFILHKIPNLLLFNN